MSEASFSIELGKHFLCKSKLYISTSAIEIRSIAIVIGVSFCAYFKIRVLYAISLKLSEIAINRLAAAILK